MEINGVKILFLSGAFKLGVIQQLKSLKTKCIIIIIIMIAFLVQPAMPNGMDMATGGSRLAFFFRGAATHAGAKPRVPQILFFHRI